VKLIVRDANGATAAETTSFTGAPSVSAAVTRHESATSPEPVAKFDPARESEVIATLARREPEANRTADLPTRAVAVNPTKMAGGLESPPPAPLRRWVAPAQAVLSAAAELPSPPSIVESFSAPIANIIPRTPVGVAPKPPTPDQGPTSGRLIWTGKLARGATMQILGGRNSLGRMTGSLPGVPVRVRVFPTELTQNGLKVFTSDPLLVGVPEAPGAQNGWMQTTWVLDPRKAGDLRMIEVPSQENGWNRLSVRAERTDHAVIVLHWDRHLGGP